MFGLNRSNLDKMDYFDLFQPIWTHLDQQLLGWTNQDPFELI